jgi:Ser/Thr protein kinase RdoA (MazF antagonist)
MSFDASVQQAIGQWGLRDGNARMISHRENAVFAIRLNDGQPAALRLHRPGYNSVNEIWSELWWTNALAEAGFPAPKPVATPDETLLVTLDNGQIATVISWVDGAPIGFSGQPLPGSDADQIKRYTDVGKLLAQLHDTSDALTLPANFTRRSWDHTGLLGDNPLWGRFWEHPGLDSDAQDTLNQARAKARTDLTAYDKTNPRMGLIHADALRENVFATANGLTLIDFDDSGFGYTMFELTVAVSQSIDEANYSSLCQAVIEGYAAVHPLTHDDIARIPLFAMLRGFASLGWIVPRLPAEDPNNDKYIRRAILLSKRYLDT